MRPRMWLDDDEEEGDMAFIAEEIETRDVC